MLNVARDTLPIGFLKTKDYLLLKCPTQPKIALGWQSGRLRRVPLLRTIKDDNYNATLMCYFRKGHN